MIYLPYVCLLDHAHQAGEMGRFCENHIVDRAGGISKGAKAMWCSDCDKSTKFHTRVHFDVPNQIRGTPQSILTRKIS